MKTRLKLAAAAVAIALSLLSVAALAACCGSVGADGSTQTFWTGTDGSISLWKLDSRLNAVGSHVYGPYVGWSPVSLVVSGYANASYLLWSYTDGTASIWVLDTNLNFVISREFGPVAGWSPEGLGIDGQDHLRLFWHTPSNQVAVWVFASPFILDAGVHPTYGPYFGWVY
jgi:hypothetical protein